MALRSELRLVPTDEGLLASLKFSSAVGILKELFMNCVQNGAKKIILILGADGSLNIVDDSRGFNHEDVSRMMIMGRSVGRARGTSVNNTGLKLAAFHIGPLSVFASSKADGTVGILAIGQCSNALNSPLASGGNPMSFLTFGGAITVDQLRAGAVTFSSSDLVVQNAGITPDFLRNLVPRLPGAHFHTPRVSSSGATSLSSATGRENMDSHALTQRFVYAAAGPKLVS